MTEKTLRQIVNELGDLYVRLHAILARHPEPKGIKSMQPFDVCEYCGSDIKSCPQGCYCSNPDCGYVDGYYNKPVTPGQLREKQQQLAAERKLADDLAEALAHVLPELSEDSNFASNGARALAAYRAARGITER